MILVGHPGSRIRMLTFYPIPDHGSRIQGVKKAPDPGSRIRIRNTAPKYTWNKKKQALIRVLFSRGEQSLAQNRLGLDEVGTDLKL